MGLSENNNTSTPLNGKSESGIPNYGSVTDGSEAFTVDKNADIFIHSISDEEEDDFCDISMDKELRRQKKIVLITMGLCLLLMVVTVTIPLQQNWLNSQT